MNELFCEIENGVALLDSLDLLRLLLMAFATASNACVKSFFYAEGDKAIYLDPHIMDEA